MVAVLVEHDRPTGTVVGILATAVAGLRFGLRQAKLGSSV